jgi:hypothetical protein
MGRTIITEKDVRKAREARDHHGYLWGVPGERDDTRKRTQKEK